jgi:hypothetical protein
MRIISRPGKNHGTLEALAQLALETRMVKKMIRGSCLFNAEIDLRLSLSQSVTTRLG